MQWGCQSYAMRLSKLWNELVTAMLWGRQMPQVSGSKHSYERLRCHMWQFRRGKIGKLKQKSRYLTRFSFLDWTEKLARICNGNSELFQGVRSLLWGQVRNEKGKKKRCRCTPTFVNLKSNTMKNTMQRYAVCANNARKFMVKMYFYAFSWFISSIIVFNLSFLIFNLLKFRKLHFKGLKGLKWSEGV